MTEKPKPPAGPGDLSTETPESPPPSKGEPTKGPPPAGPGKVPEQKPGVTAPQSTPSLNRVGSVEDLTRQNVERIQALETREQEKATTADRVADTIAHFAGSVAFVWVTVLVIGGWIVWNLRPPTRGRIDPFPFPLLTLVLSIEAIFLSIFILMSQNRAARVSDKRSHLDLQLTMLSEQENTKMLLMLQQIAKAVRAEVAPDSEVQILVQTTAPETVSQQIDSAVDDASGTPGSKV